MFMPKMIAEISTLHLHDRLEANIPLLPYFTALTSKGWRFYVTTQRRGYCTDDVRKVITIPQWVLDKKDKLGYFDWYCAHEMAHAYAGARVQHGPIFQQWLKKICPIEYQGYEVSYKPRAMIAAGLSLDCFLDDF